MTDDVTGDIESQSTAVAVQADGWRDRVAGSLATLRTADGGFAKSPQGRAGSTYQTFLNVLCHQLLDRPIDRRDALAHFVASHRRDDGGYLEIRVAKRSGVNPTAAAIGTLRCIDEFGSLSPDAVESTKQFLHDRQNSDGGVSANTRIPFSDLLSTFTATWTLAELDPTDERWSTYAAAAGDYARRMVAPEGGFYGFELDATADVEYTFYGLANLALAAASKA